MDNPLEHALSAASAKVTAAGKKGSHGRLPEAAIATEDVKSGNAGATVIRLSANDSRRKGRLCHGHVQLLGRDVPISLVTLALTEAMVLMAAFWFAVELRFPEGAVPGFYEVLNVKLGLFVAVNLMAMLCMGLYRRGLSGSLADTMVRVMGAFMLGAVLLAALFYVIPSLFFGRGVLVLAGILAFVGVIATRLLVGQLLGLNSLKRHVLVLGTGKTASMFKQICERSNEQNFELVNFAAQGNDTSVMDPAVLVRLDRRLDEYARLHHIDDIVIAMDDHRGGLPIAELIACKMSGINVLETSDFFERECGFLKLDTLRPSAMIFSRGFRQSLYRDFTKRAMDVMVSLGLLLVAWPFMLITALGIFIESRGQGSVLFRQQRIGQNGEAFTLYKFRSMIMEAESDGVARWAQKQDPRVTRFGSFIRKTRLDELPQLFNVVRGDMSFVGPRPERPEFVGDLSARLPYYRDRHWVKPGLTGWAQINYPYGASEEDAFKKLQYDLYYVKNQGIALDLMIIAQTVEVVLWGRGAQ